MKLTFRLTAFPVPRFAAPLIQLEAAARAALLGHLAGSRGDLGPAAAPPAEPASLSQPVDRSP